MTLTLSDGRAQEPVMVLGFYDHDEEWTEDESSDKETSDEFGEHKQKIPKQHHSQLYANGSKCDLTGNLRHTEVRVSPETISQEHCRNFHDLFSV